MNYCPFINKLQTEKWICCVRTDGAPWTFVLNVRHYKYESVCYKQLCSSRRSPQPNRVLVAGWLQLVRENVDVPWRRTEHVSLQRWCPPNHTTTLWILSTLRTWNGINRSTVRWHTGLRVGYPPRWDSCLMLWAELSTAVRCCPSVRLYRTAKKLLIYCAFVNYKLRPAVFWLTQHGAVCPRSMFSVVCLWEKMASCRHVTTCITNLGPQSLLGVVTRITINYAILTHNCINQRA